MFLPLPPSLARKLLLWREGLPNGGDRKLVILILFSFEDDAMMSMTVRVAGKMVFHFGSCFTINRSPGLNLDDLVGVVKVKLTWAMKMMDEVSFDYLWTLKKTLTDGSTKYSQVKGIKKYHPLFSIASNF